MMIHIWDYSPTLTVIASKCCDFISIVEKINFLVVCNEISSKYNVSVGYLEDHFVKSECIDDEDEVTILTYHIRGQTEIVLVWER